MLALLLSACSQTLDLDIVLVTESCDPDGNLDPLKDGANEVTQFRFAVTGEGIDPASFQTLMNRGDATLTLPEIPIGPNVNIRVDALLASGVVLSTGQTGPMNLVDVTEKVPAAIFLRRTNTFTSANLVDARSTCGQLSKPRAAHAASVLSDGRVLIAGGFFDDGDKRTYLKSTEIYDPRSGKIVAGPEMKQERAYHTSTHIPGTTLTVLAGGERPNGDTGVIESLQSAEIYDDATGQLSFAIMKRARSRHAAALPPSGGLLALIGGYDASGTIDTLETFDPRKFKAGEAPFADDTVGTLARRAEHTAIGIGSEFILIAGGFDGSKLLKSTTLLRARDFGNYEVVEDWKVELSTARAAPLMALLDDNTVVVSGGFANAPPDGLKLDASNTSASNVTDVIRINNGVGEATSLTDTRLTENRARGGIASLGNGRVLIGGGASKSTTNETSTSNSAEMLFIEGEDVVSKTDVERTLREPRYQSTWTVLQDGTVLVSGGLEHVGPGQVSFLKSLEVFQPAP